MLEVRPTPDPSSYVKGLHVHRWKDQAQPPRYTIFPTPQLPSHRLYVHFGLSLVSDGFFEADGTILHGPSEIPGGENSLTAVDPRAQSSDWWPGMASVGVARKAQMKITARLHGSSEK
jgi:hypothetical protein